MLMFAPRALATLSDSTRVEKLQVILQIKRPLKVAHLRGDFQSSAVIARGYIHMNSSLKVKYLAANSSVEDQMPDSDADQT